VLTGGHLGRRPHHREDQQPGLDFNHIHSKNVVNNTVKRNRPPKSILLGRHVQPTHYQAKEAVPSQLIGKCLFAFQKKKKSSLADFKYLDLHHPRYQLSNVLLMRMFQDRKLPHCQSKNVLHNQVLGERPLCLLAFCIAG
jgi:hypothetical protein